MAVELALVLVAVSVNILSSHHPTGVKIAVGEEEDKLLAQGDLLYVNGKQMDRYTNGGEGFNLMWDDNIRSYPGSIEVWAKDGELILLNKVDEDPYLASVVGAEMVPGAKLEALEAQAVLCRTFMRTAPRHESDPWQFCDLTHCQSYKGLESTTSATLEAVRETDGLYLTYEGELCDIYYHSTSGGQTANVTSIWPDINHPYLASVSDPYCCASPHYRWEYVVSARDLSRALGFSNITDCRVIEYAKDGRVKLVGLKAGGEGLLMDGWGFRMEVCKALGWNTLKSSWFDVEQDAGAYVFAGNGLGHGVGLSQWGAKGMADEGKTFLEILTHYYQGTEVRKWR